MKFFYDYLNVENDPPNPEGEGGNVLEILYIAIMGILGGLVPRTILKVRGNVSGIPVSIFLDSESPCNSLHPSYIVGKHQPSVVQLRDLQGQTWHGI